MRIKQLLSRRQDACNDLTVNAGYSDRSLVSGLAVGGGRLIGEACHFIDLLRYIAGSSIVSVNSTTSSETNLVNVMIRLLLR